MVIKQKKYIIYLFVIFIFHQCGKKELYFNVNTSLLGELFSNDKVGISLRIPKGWKGLSKKDFSNIKDKLKEKNIEGITPLQFYINKEKGNICTISTFEKEKKIKTVVKEYKERLKKYFPDSKITYTSFYKDDIKFYQFQVVNQKFINIKLFLIGKYKNIIQIDYIVPVVHYKDELKSIESSIGSIKII